MASRTSTPIWFRIATILVVLWELMGCYACVMQIRLGAEAMGPADDWSLKYYAALPVWYNWVYVVATFGALVGGLMLLFRRKHASLFFWLSFIAIIVMFGYAFAATDLIAHKGLSQVLPFPALIAALGGLSIWLAATAARRGWLEQ